MSVEETLDSFTEDENGDEFDELDALSERGRFWSPRDPEKGHPHKLVLKALRWEKATSKFSSAERNVVVGKTKSGETWKVACDNFDLEPLYTGDVKRWNDGDKQFEVVDNWGPVRVGEVFAVEYLGDREFTTKQGQKATRGSYRYTRKPPADRAAVETQLAPSGGGEFPANTDDDVPF